MTKNHQQKSKETVLLIISKLYSFILKTKSRILIIIAFLLFFFLPVTSFASGKTEYEEALMWRNFITSDTRPVIGAALGGGGARGMAHIGFLKAMQRSGIPIDRISGTSIGSFIGALYAAGENIDAIEKLAIETNWSNLIELKTSRISIFSTRRLENFIGYHIYRLNNHKLPLNEKDFITINKTIMNNNDAGYYEVKFSDLKLPFTCSATELYSGRIVVFDTGSVSEAVRASCSIPGLFEPVQQENNILIDGGVLMNLPVSLCKNIGADFVIGVDVETDSSSNVTGLVDILSQIIKIQGLVLTARERELADFIVSPSVGSIKTSELNRTKEAIRMGEIAGMTASKRIRQKLLGIVNNEDEKINFSEKEINYLFDLIGSNQNKRATAFFPKTSDISKAVITASSIGLDNEALDLYKFADLSDTNVLYSALLSSIRLRSKDDSEKIFVHLRKKNLPEDKLWMLAAAAVIADFVEIETQLLELINNNHNTE